jgi:hypothetical protein
MHSTLLCSLSVRDWYMERGRAGVQDGARVLCSSDSSLAMASILSSRTNESCSALQRRDCSFPRCDSFI